MNLSFSGSFHYTVDSKGRVNIPAPFRSQVSDNTFNVTYGPNSSLFVYPGERFAEVSRGWARSYGSLASSDEERRFLLQIMHNAQPSRCDQQGRIIIPKTYLEHAKIEKEVLIIGVVSKMEFWNPELFEEFMNSGSMSNDELIKQFGGADRL